MSDGMTRDIGYVCSRGHYVFTGETEDCCSTKSVGRIVVVADPERFGGAARAAAAAAFGSYVDDAHESILNDLRQLEGR